MQSAVACSTSCLWLQKGLILPKPWQCEGAAYMYSLVLPHAETLAAQLAEARNSNTQLQGEVEKLNDTVFSKTFRAPSAWAEREVKYKMEKKDWDTQVLWDFTSGAVHI